MSDRALWTHTYSLKISLPGEAAARPVVAAKPLVTATGFATAKPIAAAKPLAAQPVAAPAQPVAPVAPAPADAAARPRIKSLASSFMTRYRD